MKKSLFHSKDIYSLCLLINLLWFDPSLCMAQDQNFHIYLGFGQSNMSGNATIESQDLIVDSRFQVLRGLDCNANGFVYNYGEWELAVPPLNRCDTKLGVSDYFGRTLVDSLPEKIKIGIIVVAVGGSGIELWDKHHYASYVASQPSWMQNQIAQFGGNPYARLIELGKKAQKVGVIKGILLHQGESNTGQSTWPIAVKAVYENILNDLSLESSQTPLLVGELVYSDEGGKCGSHNKVIAQLPSVIPNAHIVSADNLSQNGDGLHFTSAAYRELGARYAKKMLELLKVNHGPDVSITLPLGISELNGGDNVSIAATATSDQGEIASVKFFNGESLLVSDESAPYSHWLKNIEPGVYQIKAIATDRNGNIGVSQVVAFGVQGPYRNQSHVIPGVIQFEDFDRGGNGVAYYDDSPGSETGVEYRNDVDVDMELSTDENGGYNIGYMTAGEWLEYSINVMQAGNYRVKLRVACNADNRRLMLSSNGTSLAIFSIPNTRGWQEWQDISADIHLGSGKQILRFTMGSEDYVNLNYFSITSNSSSAIHQYSNESSLYLKQRVSHDEFYILGVDEFYYEIAQVNGVIAERGWRNMNRGVGGRILQGVYFLKIINSLGYEKVHVIYKQ